MIDNTILIFLSIYLFINLTAFIIMGRDKYLARKNKWRIPEAWFFKLSLVGGALGVWIGMNFFRHKTQHKQFVYGIPALFILNLVVIYFIWIR